MLNNDTLYKIENAMKEYMSGTLIKVVLLNIDEMHIIFNSTQTNKICNRFIHLVKEACTILAPFHLVTTHNTTELYIVSYNKPNIVRKFADIVYAETQLDPICNFAHTYVRIAVGSINFIRERNYCIYKLVSLLNYTLFNVNDVDHYYCYESHKLDIENLLTRNKNIAIIRRALKNKDFKFVYQPIICCKTGKVKYFECLLRIVLNEKLCSIGSIINDAENTGLIHMIDSLVLEMAVQELEANPSLILSINISNYGIRSNYLLYKASKLLRKYVVAERLIIEITETVFNTEFNTTTKFINALHKLGCSFALDDFGSGFTSFKQISELPLDIIKIDGSYITDIASNETSKFFVQALTKLASDLKLNTVAEFVENYETLEHLKKIGIEAIQGNIFAPASPKREYTNYKKMIDNPICKTNSN